MSFEGSIFIGVFRSREEAARAIGMSNEIKNNESFYSTYGSTRWLMRQGEMLRLARQGKIPRPSSLLSQKLLESPYKIIDFGGGSGWLYECLKNSNQKHLIKDYVVVEIPTMCKKFEREFPVTEHIKFTSSMEELKEIEFEIMYFNSSLQYLQDLEILRFKDIKFKPKYVVIDDLPISEQETFYSNQVYYGSHIQIMFVSRVLLDSIMKESGYKLIARNAIKTKISAHLSWTIEINPEIKAIAPSTFSSIYKLDRASE